MVKPSYSPSNVLTLCGACFISRKSQTGAKQVTHLITTPKSSLNLQSPTHLILRPISALHNQMLRAGIANSQLAILGHGLFWGMNVYWSSWSNQTYTLRHSLLLQQWNNMHICRQLAKNNLQSKPTSLFLHDLSVSVPGKINNFTIFQLQKGAMGINQTTNFYTNLTNSLRFTRVAYQPWPSPSFHASHSPGNMWGLAFQADPTLFFVVCKNLGIEVQEWNWWQILVLPDDSLDYVASWYLYVAYTSKRSAIRVSYGVASVPKSRTLQIWIKLWKCLPTSPTDNFTTKPSP